MTVLHDRESDAETTDPVLHPVTPGSVWKLVSVHLVKLFSPSRRSTPSGVVSVALRARLLGGFRTSQSVRTCENGCENGENLL